jgi:hypothetical protein
MGNYKSATTTQVTPTMMCGSRDSVAIAVNSYLTGWGWQSPQLIDATAPANLFPPMKQVKKYSTNTKNLRIGWGGKPPRPAFNAKTSPYQLRKDVPNIIKTQWMSGGEGDSTFNYTLSPPPQSVSILRDLSAPFICYEPFSDEALTGKNTIFTNSRFPDCDNYVLPDRNRNIVVPTSVVFTKSTETLRSPGSNGYATLQGNRIQINHINTSIWNIATFAFRIGTDFVSSQQTLLYFGNWAGQYFNPTKSNGFECVITTSSATPTYSLGIQTLTLGGRVNTPVSNTITLSKSKWHIAVITKQSITVHPLKESNYVYSLEPSLTPLQIPSQGYPRPYNKATSTYPTINIGPVTNPIDIAWLHFFDRTTASVDLNKELKGYAIGGYDTGIF